GQVEVEHDHVRRAGRDRRQRLLAVARHADAVAARLHHPRDELDDIRLVVDDQDVGHHYLPFARLRLTAPPRSAAPRSKSPIARLRSLTCYSDTSARTQSTASGLSQLRELTK